MSAAPAIVVYQKRKPLLFFGSHTASGIVDYVKKLQAMPYQILETINQVKSFEQAHINSQSLARVAVSNTKHTEGSKLDAMSCNR